MVERQRDRASPFLSLVWTSMLQRFKFNVFNGGDLCEL
jgi:hypothetical protein